VQSVLRHDARTQRDTCLDPDDQGTLHYPEFVALDAAQGFLDHAMAMASQGKDVAALDAYERAFQIDARLTEKHQGEILAAYRPGGKVLPTCAVEEILKHLDCPLPDELDPLARFRAPKSGDDKVTVPGHDPNGPGAPIQREIHEPGVPFVPDDPKPDV